MNPVSGLPLLELWLCDAISEPQHLKDYLLGGGGCVLFMSSQDRLHRNHLSCDTQGTASQQKVGTKINIGQKQATHES